MLVLAFPHFAWGDTEVSGHFGIKIGGKLNLQEITTNNQNNVLGIDQKNIPFHFGLDAIYRNRTVNGRSFGLGLRYRLAFTGERSFDATGSAAGGIRDNGNTYKFTHHRAAFLVNYRFYKDQFFIGPILGLDIWKHLKFSATIGTSANENRYEFTSSQFLWNQITGHLGLEVGYKATDNFLVKLEVGYDLSRFSNLKCKISLASAALQSCPTSGGGNNPLEMDGNKSRHTFKLDAFYTTLGVSWLFG